MSNPINILFNEIRKHPYYFLLTILLSTASCLLIYFLVIKANEDKRTPK